MSKFKIKVARIETVAGAEEDTQVRITFQVDRGLITFQVPIFLSISDFDDSEMVQAARMPPGDYQRRRPLWVRRPH